MPIPWDSDPIASDRRIASNLHRVLHGIASDANIRVVPTVDMARAWHRESLTGVRIPVAYYAGEVRDSDLAFPGLIGYEVLVGTVRGVASADVPTALVSFEAGVQALITLLDSAFAVGARPATPQQVRTVLRAASIVHGEWIRIHPFANGNGRIARLWANWFGLRYGLPAFVALRPRPSGIDYAAAATASMQGDHDPMVPVFKAMLDATLSGHP